MATHTKKLPIRRQSASKRPLITRTELGIVAAVVATAVGLHSDVAKTYLGKVGLADISRKGVVEQAEVARAIVKSAPLASKAKQDIDKIQFTFSGQKYQVQPIIQANPDADMDVPNKFTLAVSQAGKRIGVVNIKETNGVWAVKGTSRIEGNQRAAEIVNAGLFTAAAPKANLKPKAGLTL